MTTFFILFSIFVLIATTVLIFTSWYEVKKKATLELQYINKMVSSSYASDLRQYETLMGLLGARLQERNVLKHPYAAQKVIRRPLETNPALAGFGIARPDGQLLGISYIPKNYPLPNLLEDKHARESFQETLKKRRMVVGHTYFVELIGKWVIPLRVPIYDDRGKLSFILTSGIDLSLSENSWNSSSFPNHIGIALVRDDNYFSYVSDIDKKDYSAWYYQPVPRETLSQLGSKDIRATGANTFDIVDRSGNKLLVNSTYDRDFHFLSITDVSYEKLYKDLYNQLNYFVLGIILFYLFTLYFYTINHKRDKELTRELIWTANHDALTTLPNRYFLQNKTKHWNDLHRNYSALFMDLNNFKSINDNYGHPFGDKLLIILAKRLKSVIEKHEHVIRQGGDEFIILTPRAPESIAQFAQHIIHILNEMVIIDNITLYPKITIGIAHYPQDAESIDLLLSKADMALYKAKENKIGYLEYSHKLDEASKKRLDIELQLRNAIENDEMYMLLQPQLNAGTLEVEGVEALIRWNNPKLGQISPDQFITIAEETGQIHELGHFALKRACYMALKVWQETNTTFTLSVNASADELLHKDYLAQVLMVVEETGFPKDKLMIEVTESLLINDVRKAKEVLTALRLEGIGISLDDFGTGYSSLSMLKGLPVTELKIDQSFIFDMLHDEQNLQLTRSIITLGNLLELKIVAEGVEDEAQVFELQNSDCTLLQGYYFSKPLSETDLITFINDSIENEVIA